MPSVIESTQRFQADLRAREARALRRMIADWEAVIRNLEEQAIAVGELIETARLNGTPVSEDWLLRQQLAEDILVQAQRELDLLTGRHTPYLLEQLKGAALTGAQMGAAQVGIAIGGRLSADAVRAIAAATQAGPVGDLLASIDITGALRRALINGIARGANPRAVAREVVRNVQISRNRALTIARTEMARAQRSATYGSYAAAGVTTWVWVCARSTRTCAACWAIDGQVFETREQISDHPNGRCTMIPGEARMTTMASRDEAWARLSESDKRRILGPSRYDLVSSGKATIGDMGGVWITKPEWGQTVRVHPLSRL